MKKPKESFSKWFWRKTAFWRTGAGLAILTVSLVGLRWLWLQVERPAHLEENAALYGSIRDFSGRAQMNHDGSRLIYVAPADDRGHAVFLADVATGKRRQIIEDKQGVGIWNDDFVAEAGPWSPDDRYFLCNVSNRLMVCSAGANLENVLVDEQAFSSQAVWLTPDRIAYVTEGTNLCTGQRGANGQWAHRLILSRPVPLASLVAISPNTVAWLENAEVICRANLDGSGTGVPPVSASGDEVTAPPTNGLAIWLDASRLRQTDQEPVTELPDLSRNKNDAVRNGTPPVFNGPNSPHALGGRGTIHFGWLDSAANGTGLKTRAPLGIAGTVPRSVFVVMRHEADRAMMVSMGDTSAHGALFGVEWSERLFLPTGWWADNYVDATSTDWNLLEVVYDSATLKGYLNGLLKCTASPALNTVERGVEIGFRDGADAKAAEGDFAELLIYDRALNNAERRRVEDYLNGKWFGKQSVTPPHSLVWYDPGLEGMTGLAYAQETGQLLINRTEAGHDSILRLDTASGPGASPVPVNQGQASASDGQWAGADKIIYTSRLDTRLGVKLADAAGTEKKSLLDWWGDGRLEWFQMTPDQKQVFLLGTVSNTPAPAIWKCNLESGGWQSVVSSSDYPSPLAQAVEISSRNLSLEGSSATYTFFRPANFHPGKKYPLLIGDTTISTSIYGEPFMKGVAACGAIVAVVDRPNWTPGLDLWAQNVSLLYDDLKRDPAVDMSRVYLFAVSAETHYCSELMRTNPAPWRGVILLNPSELPDFSQSPWFQPRPKMLLDAGAEEHEDDRFQQYQLRALNWGVLVEYHTHPGETHRMVGSIGRLERVREEKHFIFEE